MTSFLKYFSITLLVIIGIIFMLMISEESARKGLGL